MKLNISSLPFGKQEFNYHVDGQFFNEIEASEVRSGSVDVALEVSHTAEGVFELEFSCRGFITIPCDRCLDDMEFPVSVDYHLSVKQGEDYDDSGDDVLIIPLAWRTLELDAIVRDTVLLSIPMMHTHADGGCNEEMLARLSAHSPEGYSDDADFAAPGEEAAAAGGEATDPRWDALKGLLGSDAATGEKK